VALTAVWVGGSVARPGEVGPQKFELVKSGSSDIPWSDINGDPINGGVRYRGVRGTRSDFYFPISNPVILNDKRVSLTRVFVLYQAGISVEFTAYSVMDGLNQIVAPQSVSLVGPLSLHTGIVMGKNAWDIVPSISVFSGLTIVVTIDFIKSGIIFFTTAGADFDV
jgi:hypothetical protein